VNFTGSEFLILLVVALIVLGPDKLPEAARKMGSFLREARQMSHGFRQELMDAIDEPSREVKSTFLEPMEDLKRSMQGPLDDLKQSLRSPVVPAAGAAATAGAVVADGPSEAAAEPTVVASAAGAPETPMPAAGDEAAPPIGPPLPGVPAPTAPTPPTRRPAPGAPPADLQDDDGLFDLLGLPEGGDHPGPG
jgi:sec-independent protein translocase protein TatB